MNIRIMTINDYEQVYSLWLSTPNMGLNNIDDSKDGIAKYLARNPNTCFVAERANVIIGVILSGHDGRRGYIHHTAVAQGEQCHGTGTALVNAAIQGMAGIVASLGELARSGDSSEAEAPVQMHAPVKPTTVTQTDETTTAKQSVVQPANEE